jgi:hypothetical protein
MRGHKQTVGVNEGILVNRVGGRVMMRGHKQTVGVNEGVLVNRVGGRVMMRGHKQTVGVNEGVLVNRVGGRVMMRGLPGDACGAPPASAPASVPQHRSQLSHPSWVSLPVVCGRRVPGDAWASTKAAWSIEWAGAG